MSEKRERFQQYLNQMEQYKQIMAQMEWDMQTQTPQKGYAYKIDAITYFSSERFRIATSEETGKLFREMAAPEEYAALDDVMKLTVRRGKRDYDRDKRVPADFYEEMVRESNVSGKAWEEAKQKSDYALFCPHLQKMIDYTRRYIAYREPDKEVYDTLLDMYEEGMDSATIDRLFLQMKEELVPLFRKIMEKPEPDNRCFAGDYDINRQKELQSYLLSYIGFDKEAGVTGESEHPFTLEFGPGDVRITNHFDRHDAVNAMFSAIHEGGHAIFEQGINPAYMKTAATDIGMALHESQSRFYENILGRNINFWKPIYDKVGEYLPQFQDIPLDTFYREINHVRPSFIRTAADELTYCFHIILRYELEKAIFGDGVNAKELPKLWNDKMEELLGIRPKNDAEGILQDMHWSDGSFGYFPTYLLGTIYDGMFLETMEQELGSVDMLLSGGRIGEITGWLHEKIHKYGGMRTAAETIREVCGQEMTAEPIVRYFKKKYTKIYGL